MIQGGFLNLQTKSPLNSGQIWMHSQAKTGEKSLFFFFFGVASVKEHGKVRRQGRRRFREKARRPSLLLTRGYRQRLSPTSGAGARWAPPGSLFLYRGWGGWAVQIRTGR